MVLNLKALLGMLFVFIGCCSNVVFLELIIQIDPGAGNLITFAQFLFIALEGLVFTSKFFTVRPKIALKDYVILVALFFGANVCNNYAFNFNIPMPLHMIFRSGSLMANMIMGIVLLKKRYNLRQYSSVAMIPDRSGSRKPDHVRPIPIHRAGGTRLYIQVLYCAPEDCAQRLCYTRGPLLRGECVQQLCVQL